MNKYILILLFSFCASSFYAQTTDSTSNKPYSEQVPLKDRIYFGGNFWANFGTFTLVNISPRVGYKLTEDFSVGIGGRYQYSSVRYSNAYRESASVYGGSAFARYNMFENLFLTTEYESLNVTNYFYYPGTTAGQVWTDFWFVGGGYAHGSGGGLRFQAVLLYDLLNNPNLGYFYPRVSNQVPLVLRIGMTFGI